MTEPFPGGITAPQDWLNGLLPYLPSVGVDSVKHEILTTLRTFFATSGAWRDWIGPFNLLPDTVLYSIELSDYKAELVALLEGYRQGDGLPLSIASRDQIGADKDLLEPGTPNYMHVTPEGLVQIWPPPPTEEPCSVRLYATMKPIDLCVPTWIKSQYYDAICSGVFASMFSKPGPNLNLQMATWHRRLFKDEIAKASMTAIASGSLIPERIIAPVMVYGRQHSRGGVKVAFSGSTW